jgi:hypothetical protein
LALSFPLKRNSSAALARIRLSRRRKSSQINKSLRNKSQNHIRCVWSVLRVVFLAVKFSAVSFSGSGPFTRAFLLVSRARSLTGLCEFECKEMTVIRLLKALQIA